MAWRRSQQRPKNSYDVSRNELLENSSESSIDSSSDVLGELARDFPDIAAEIEAGREEDEKKRVAKRRRKLPGPISFRLEWNTHMRREVNKQVGGKKVEEKNREAGG